MASYRVALTGGAGAGKSAAAQIFAECGAVVVCADHIAHELMEPGQAANRQIRALFGEHIADSEGHIMRDTLRSHIFGDESARKALEAILHPPIHEALRLRTSCAQPYAVLVIPLLAETGRPSYINQVLVIDIDPDLQRARLTARGLEPATIERLLAIQATPEARRLCADTIIRNEDSRESLRAHILALHDRYLRLAKGP